jgi:hypothetical protein
MCTFHKKEGTIARTKHVVVCTKIHRGGWGTGIAFWTLTELITEELVHTSHSKCLKNNTKKGKK